MAEQSVDSGLDGAIEVREDLNDPDGAAATTAAREIKSLGAIQRFDDQFVEMTISSNELRLVARAINYAGVRTPKKKHDQHTYIAISEARICFKTTRAGTTCGVTFSHDSDLGAKLPADAVAFELEPHVLPAIVSIDGGKRLLYLTYDRQNDTLKVGTKDRDKSDLFVALFGTKKVAPETVFAKDLEAAKQLGNKPPEALRRGLEFARLLCRRDDSTGRHRGVTLQDGVASGGYHDGASWCTHQAFAGISADIGYEQVADFCRLLARLSTTAQCWLEDSQITFHDAPTVCTCDIAKPSWRPDFVGNLPADVSVTVARNPIFYQSSMFAALATTKTKERLAVHGSVSGSDTETRLEFRFKPGVARMDHLRAWFGTPAVRRAASASSPAEWTFSSNIADLVKILEFLDVGEIEIGKSSNGLVFIADANPGEERFVAALLDPKVDLGDIPAPR